MRPLGLRFLELHGCSSLLVSGPQTCGITTMDGPAAWCLECRRGSNGGSGVSPEGRGITLWTSSLYPGCTLNLRGMDTIPKPGPHL